MIKNRQYDKKVAGFSSCARINFRMKEKRSKVKNQKTSILNMTEGNPVTLIRVVDGRKVIKKLRETRK
ncbi:hypothetical protein WAA20_16335 [Butyrivibrio fibrisolvens]|uniref:hypothetical protein n=1 Tax=Butyrivibrio fibrisolvens TaxID=831 RepID=UPI000933DDBB